jgi:hypothetical protein
MKEKYVLTKPYTCSYGTLPEGSEIIYFRGQMWVNGGPIPSSFNDIFLDLIKDKEYVTKMKITQNKI